MLARKKLLNLVLVTVLVAFFGVTTSAATQTAAGFVSDDFNPCGPLTVWTPTTGAGQSITSNNTQLSIAVTANETQTIWAQGGVLTYNVARMMQPFAGSGLTDLFEIEAKFDSKVTSPFQQQGIVVEQDSTNVLRFEFYHDGGQGTVLYYARFITQDGVTSRRGQGSILLGDTSGAAALYMKVARVAPGNVYTLNYRTDTTSYADPAPLSFTQSNFNVSQVGVFAGASPFQGNPVPAHTAIVDYFFNLASPIANEDSESNTLSVTPSGSGTVDVSPTQPQGGYACGADVQLTANPDPGWSFVRWEGALTGSQNPATVTMDGAAKEITAVFTQSGAVLDLFIYLPLASK